MNKCEWKDGEFEACSSFEPISDTNAFGQYTGKVFCKGCQTIIPQSYKSESMIVMVMSGEAIVCNDEGIDYICVEDTDQWRDMVLSGDYKSYDGCIENNKQYWKSFTGPNPDITELTDKIAKLRPMVIHKELPTISIILYGINENQAIFIPPVHMLASNIRLVTAKELQEEKQG